MFAQFKQNGRKSGTDGIDVAIILAAVSSGVLFFAPDLLTTIIELMNEPVTTLGSNLDISAALIVAAASIGGVAFKNYKGEFTSVEKYALIGTGGTVFLVFVSPDFANLVNYHVVTQGAAAALPGVTAFVLSTDYY